MKKSKLFGGLVLSASLFLAACGNSGTTADSSAAESSAAAEATTVKIGLVSESAVEIWEAVAERLEDDNIDLEIVKFTDYNQPNIALDNGEIDLNAFQHVAFLENYNANNDADLTPIGFTFVSPLGIYSDKYEDYSEIQDGDTIAIPNDVTNGGRALLLLQAIDLITLDNATGTTPTVADIIENPKNLNIEELDAAQLPRSLQDAGAAVINTNFAVDAGLVPTEDALYLDTDNIQKVLDIYKNVVAARAEDVDNEVYKKVVAEYQTEETKALIAETTANTDIPAWD
ncbi:MetQ/NlpA family ABC transporter substrate-binding protein [Trichococcus ilyis]|jgi:D-methionine transport system substrate-binding protein|uniref:Lipoprotein n=1 Tax=Trichococcus ilyis TaxID=640938 RepID=A0A143YG10_9LACT|nr:MetQ/NlpA family ABC transporter substrate-binding protein [Trichococcus ilyis]CZQ88661.1 nlpa lipoprotein [Trichococcus ilyis]SEI87680.1 D-methionine transport system substrate-binding protein [Trichococcus ilyis]